MNIHFARDMIRASWLKGSTILSFLAVVLFACNNREASSNGKDDMEEYLELTLEERLLPENATKSFKTTKDLEVVLFASEPMVVNPTNIDVDGRGRVWVCESYNYAKPQDQIKEEGGRIIILEDTDKDGKADKRTVFYQGEDVHIALGIAVMGNKVYVTRSPDLLVFTDENGDDIPDRKEKLFTGMGKPGDHSAHAVVFGPDGKLYWNTGNSSGPVLDSSGNQVKDMAGRDVVQDGNDYLGGMVYRCNMDGSEFEVLGHNFRNNYEVAVDAYGNIWQSDNDDDGNRSCRINFVMEYGNYGYLDEMTRESWPAHRTNPEDSIPHRHWHQNDPGVVPNLLITGAGSPAGMAVYEGNMMPPIFHGQVIHVDAGPNIARSYPVKKIGAGFEASVVNIVESRHDQWFRPVDITVAPDGSLFIADWYDPGVGGGAAGDFDRGRIFRVASDVSSYKIKPVEVSTLDGAIDAIKSPNISTRHLAWMALHKAGRDAEKVLNKLYESTNPVYKARALWLLGKIPGKGLDYVNLALKDKNPDIRLTAIRLSGQLEVDFLEIAKKMAHDPIAAVRREIAIGLHLEKSTAAAQVWVDLALQHDGNDRWYLEALGIGAANNWDACFSGWLKSVKEGWSSPAGKDIIWRSRSEASIEYLGKLISDVGVIGNERLKYFRAFDFHKNGNKQEILLQLLDIKHPAQADIRSLALQHIDPSKVTITNSLSQVIDETLSDLKGTREYLNLVDRFDLFSKKNEVLQLVMSEDRDLAIDAARLLLDPDRFNGRDLLKSFSNSGEEEASALISAVESIGNREALSLMSYIVFDTSQTVDIRKAAVVGLGKSWSGEDELLSCVKKPEFDPLLHAAAASVLFNVYRISIHEEAAQYIQRPASSTGQNLPPIREMVASVGNSVKGKEVFQTYCQTCHVVEGVGTDFGPGLSDIGNKLSKEGLYRAIMFPGEGISYGYEGKMLMMKDGSTILGIIESETEELLEVKMIGGSKIRYPVQDVGSVKPAPQSLMPNFSASMSQEQLADLVQYLTELGK